MDIKSDKTFEEIVERLVALFKGQHEDGVTEAQIPRSPSPSADARPPSSALTTPSDDEATS